MKKNLQFQNTLEDMTPTVRKHFGEIVLNFTCLPVDIKNFNWNDENLTAGPIFYIMSTIRRMSLQTLKEFARHCEGVGSKRIQKILLDEGLCYFNRYDPVKFSWDRIGKILNEVFNEGDEIVKRITFGEKMAREEGREEGERRRERELALEMLAEGESVAKICKYTKLTEKEVNALKTEKLVA